MSQRLMSERLMSERSNFFGAPHLHVTALAALLALAAVGRPAGAQSGPATAAAVPVVAVASPGLALAEAMRLTLNAHPSVQSRRAAIAAAGSELDGAEWKRYPSVGVTTGQGLSGTAPGSTVFISQPLWTGGRISSEIEGRQAQVQASSLALRETEQELLQRVAQTFGEALRLGERVQVAEQNSAEHERLRGIIARRVENDAGAPVDLALADARLQQARLELLQLRSQRVTMVSVLGQLIAAPVGTLKEPLPSQVGEPAWQDAGQLADAVLAYSPTIKRLQAELAYAQSQVRQADSVLWPQLSLRLQRSVQKGVTEPSDLRAYFLMEFQPGAGLSALTSKDAALHRLAGARAAIESATLDLRDQSDQRFNEAKVAFQGLRPTRANVQSNADVVNSYLRQFAAGRKSWQEVLNAQREYAQARHALADMQASTRLAVLKMQVLTGELSRATLEQSSGAWAIQAN